MILWLTYWYPDADNPVRGNFIRAQWLAARAAGAEVELLFVDMAKGPKVIDVTWKRGPEGEHIIQVRSRMWKTLYHTPIWATNLLAKKWTNKTGLPKPDALHAQVVFPAGILADQLSRRWNIPFAITEHWSKAGRWTQHKLFGQRVRGAYQDAAAIYPVSEHLKQELQQVLPAIEQQRFTVIPNVVDLDKFPYKAHHISQESKQVTLLGVASLIPANTKIKRVDLVLETLVSLVAQYPQVDWQYRHVGSGGRLARLQTKAAQLGIANRVTWLGGLDSASLCSEYHAADLFLQPSHTETFGIVVLEAMHAGLHVIVSDIPAFSHWVVPENGLRVPLTTEGFTEGILSAWKDGMAPPALGVMAKKYAPTEVGAYIVEMYRLLFGKRPAR